MIPGKKDTDFHSALLATNRDSDGEVRDQHTDMRTSICADITVGHVHREQADDELDNLEDRVPCGKSCQSTTDQADTLEKDFEPVAEHSPNVPDSTASYVLAPRSGHRLFLSCRKAFQAKFRDVFVSATTRPSWIPGDGFADVEAVPDFTFFSTGRHKKRATKPISSFTALELTMDNGLEDRTQRTPLRPKIQRLTQHQLRLRRGPARDFWPTESDFTDDSAVFHPSSRLTDTADCLDSIECTEPSVTEAPQLQQMEFVTTRSEPRTYRYITPPVRHSTMGFENFGRPVYHDESGDPQVSQEMYQVRAWRTDSAESDSDEEPAMEIEYLPSSSASSVSGTENEASAMLEYSGEDSSDDGDHEDEDDISRTDLQSPSTTSVLDHGLETVENSPMILAVTTKSHDCATEMPPVLDSRDNEGTSYFKMIRARRAAQSGWPVESQITRQSSDVLWLGGNSRAGSHVSQALPLVRQLTT